MEEKNSKFGLGMLVGILAILVIGLSAFIVYDKVLSKDNNSDKNNGENVENIDENNGEKVTQLSLTDTLVTTLSDTFYGKFLESESKYANYFYKQNKTVVANVPDELKMIITFYKLNMPESVTDSDFKKAYQQIFGSNAVVPNTLPNDCPVTYTHDNGVYAQPLYGGCGGTSASMTFSKLINAKQILNNNQDSIVISEAVAFMTYDITSQQSKLYKDVQNSEFVENYNDNNNKNPLDNDYSKYAQYDYTFVKDASGIYVFTSVERIK